MEKRGRVRNESADRRLMITIDIVHARKNIEWVIYKHKRWSCIGEICSMEKAPCSMEKAPIIPH